MRFFTQVLASALGALIALLAVAFGSFVFFLLLLALFSTGKEVPTVRDHSVLTLNITGPVLERAPVDPISQLLTPYRPLSLKEIRRTLEEAARDERIEVLYLEPRFVTAGWATLNEIRRALLTFRKSGKPIVAYAGTDGFTERDYYLASVADEIYAPPEAFFELNGFFLSVTFFQDLLQKLEIEPQVVRAGTYKSAVEPFIRDTLSEANREQLMDWLQAQAAVFSDSVARRRQQTSRDIDALAERGIFTAREALEAGLLDSLFYADQVEARLRLLSRREADEKVERIKVRDYYRTLKVGPLAEDEIAVIYAEGAIVSGESVDDGLQGTLMGSETIARALRQARESERVKAVVLRVQSPGGSITASDAIWREARLLAEAKPLVVSMGDVAASGGYYIATPADTIVADPLTVTGSIGVFSLFFDVSDLFEDKLGIDFDVLKTAPHADMFSGLRPLSAVEQRRLAEQTEQFYRDFLERVAEGRGMSLDEVRKIAEGRIWPGVRAKEIGLVDVLGGLEDAIRIAAEMAGLETYRIRELPRRKSWLERLGSSPFGEVRGFYYRWVASDMERQFYRWQQKLEQVRRWHGKVLAWLPLEFQSR